MAESDLRGTTRRFEVEGCPSPIVRLPDCWSGCGDPRTSDCEAERGCCNGAGAAGDMDVDGVKGGYRPRGDVRKATTRLGIGPLPRILGDINSAVSLADL